MKRRPSGGGCPVCCAPLRFERALYDDRYGYPGTFSVFRCANCGHKSLDAGFNDEALSELYSRYYPRADLKTEDVKPRSPCRGLGAWLNGERRSAYCWVPRGVRVLDIGCGFGEALAYHKSRGCEVFGVEVDENVRRSAIRFGLQVHIGVFDPDIYEPEFFDYVTMDQVVEHFMAPASTLAGVARILKSGGRAILSTPNPYGWGARFFGNRWINWHVPYHLQLFSATSMTIVAEAAGLKVERLRTVTFSDWLYWQWIHLATFPAEGTPSTFWAQRRGQPLHNNSARAALSMINRVKVNHLITRFFDAIGYGDNHLFFLIKP